MSLLAGIKILWKQMGKQILSEEHVLAEVVSLGCRCRHLKLAPPGLPKKNGSKSTNTAAAHHTPVAFCTRPYENARMEGKNILSYFKYKAFRSSSVWYIHFPDKPQMLLLKIWVQFICSFVYIVVCMCLHVQLCTCGGQRAFYMFVYTVMCMCLHVQLCTCRGQRTLSGAVCFFLTTLWVLVFELRLLDLVKNAFTYWSLVLAPKEDGDCAA